MVNTSLPSRQGVRGVGGRSAATQSLRERICSRKAATRALAQILGKLYFLDLDENSRRILLDYEQNCTCSANTAFKGAC
jgi:hypothetical protein